MIGRHSRPDKPRDGSTFVLDDDTPEFALVNQLGQLLDDVLALGFEPRTHCASSRSTRAAIDVRLASEWSGHPRRFVVEPTEDFLHKAARALALLRSEVPECCRHHVRRFFWDDGASAEPGP